MEDQMTLKERLLAVQRNDDGSMSDAVNIDAMETAASEIQRLRATIERYLADDFSCNGGAQKMFEAALAINP